MKKVFLPNDVARPLPPHASSVALNRKQEMEGNGKGWICYCCVCVVSASEGDTPLLLWTILLNLGVEEAPWGLEPGGAAKNVVQVYGCHVPKRGTPSSSRGDETHCSKGG